MIDRKEERKTDKHTDRKELREREREIETERQTEWERDRQTERDVKCWDGAKIRLKSKENTEKKNISFWCNYFSNDAGNKMLPNRLHNCGRYLSM